MSKDIVIRIDVRTAVSILAVISVVLVSYFFLQPPRLETYILFDDTCGICMEGLRTAVNALTQQGIDLGNVVEVNVWGAGRRILRDINARVAPLIVFRGEPDPRILPSTVKVGRYYVFSPTWPLRAFDPEKKRIDVYVHTENVYAEFLRYYIMRTVPNAVVHILPPEREYIVLIEVAEEDANLVRTAVRTDSEIHLKDKVLLGTKKMSEVAIDVFLTSFGEHSKKLVKILSNLKQALGEHIKIIPHYRFVGGVEGYSGNRYCLADDLCAPGGPPEVLQNLLEICVYIMYGENTWLSFTNATQRCDGNTSCVLDIAEKMGMDLNALDACVREEGFDRALKDITLSRVHGISVVPTAFVGGWFPILGIQEENVYIEAVCGMLRDDLCPR